ncbi:ankyrin repeat-containing domain protein [Astrocystis sublimbata]|nr:ankyrin repeat-containing domain protein [Astrocystis sublimbata]
MMEMQTDNPRTPYTDPVAAPGSDISAESLALNGAANAGDVSRVRALLSSLADEVHLPIPSAQYLRNAHLRSATHDLQDASGAGDVDGARSVLHAWKADPSLKNPTPEDMDMALINAARNAHGAAVRLLLDEGALVGLTAPKLAAKEGDGAIEVFQAFLDHGWDINSFDRIPALHSATKSCSMTKWFLRHGADPNLVSKDGHTPLDFAVTYIMPTTNDVVDLLISSGVILTQSNALHNALVSVQSDDECKTIMQQLLNRGFDINSLSFRNQPFPRSAF